MKHLILTISAFLIFAIQACAQHKATLSWTASTDPGVSYNVYRSTASGVYTTPVNTTPVSATSFIDTTVVVGTKYFYVVRATLGGVESVNSNEVSATIPLLAPGGLVLTVQ
jgi:fibronectin type 3 domain-containing protein